MEGEGLDGIEAAVEQVIREIFRFDSIFFSMFDEFVILKYYHSVVTAKQLDVVRALSWLGLRLSRVDPRLIALPVPAKPYTFIKPPRQPHHALLVKFLEDRVYSDVLYHVEEITRSLLFLVSEKRLIPVSGIEPASIGSTEETLASVKRWLGDRTSRGIRAPLAFVVDDDGDVDTVSVDCTPAVFFHSHFLFVVTDEAETVAYNASPLKCAERLPNDFEYASNRFAVFRSKYVRNRVTYEYEHSVKEEAAMNHIYMKGLLCPQRQVEGTLQYSGTCYFNAAINFILLSPSLLRHVRAKLADPERDIPDRDFLADMLGRVFRRDVHVAEAMERWNETFGTSYGEGGHERDVLTDICRRVGVDICTDIKLADAWDDDVLVVAEYLKSTPPIRVGKRRLETVLLSFELTTGGGHAVVMAFSCEKPYIFDSNSRHWYPVAEYNDDDIEDALNDTYTVNSWNARVASVLYSGAVYSKLSSRGVTAPVDLSHSREYVDLKSREADPRTRPIRGGGGPAIARAACASVCLAVVALCALVGSSGAGFQ